MINIAVAIGGWERRATSSSNHSGTFPCIVKKHSASPQWDCGKSTPTELGKTRVLVESGWNSQKLDNQGSFMRQLLQCFGETASCKPDDTNDLNLAVVDLLICSAGPWNPFSMKLMVFRAMEEGAEVFLGCEIIRIHVDCDFSFY